MVSLSLYVLRNLESSQTAHTSTFVAAKHLSVEFQAKILSARISFIYFVTIQKPGSLESGWKSYGEAESAVRSLHLLVDKEPELQSLRSPAAKLESDLSDYNATLVEVLRMVQAGEKSGPHYDAMVKTWASKGQTMVQDAGTFDELSYQSSEANSKSISSLLRAAQGYVAGLFSICLLLSYVLKLYLDRRTSPTLESRPPQLAY